MQQLSFGLLNNKEEISNTKNFFDKIAHTLT